MQFKFGIEQNGFAKKLDYYSFVFFSSVFAVLHAYAFECKKLTSIFDFQFFQYLTKSRIVTTGIDKISFLFACFEH
jgi:hypothetical protein